MKVLSLFVVFLAFEVITANPSPQLRAENDNIEAIDLVGIVKVALKVLVKGLNITVDASQSFGKQFAKDPESAIKKLEDTGVKLANKIYSEITNVTDKVLDEIEDHLNEAGKKCVSCIRVQKSNARDIVDEAVVGFANCTSKDIPKIIAASQSLLTAGLEIRQELSAAEIILDQCKSGPLCLVQLLGNLKDLPDGLLNALKAAPTLIDALVKIAVNDLPPCVIYDVKLTRQNIIDLIDNTMTCMVN